MSLAYAPDGLLAVFTPQANTTVEPELAILMPPGMAWLNARMTSDRPTIMERLVDYIDQFPGLLDQFANAPVDAVALGCTGASYLIGREREDALLADILARTRKPAFTGASASVDALNRLGAKRIGLVSPYNSVLDSESAGYWQSRGFDVVAEANAFRETSDFHPIYSLEASAAINGVRELAGHDLDAILMLGTGMPTLDAIGGQPYLGRAPVLSCMLCLAWKFAALQKPEQDTKDGVTAWVEGAHWKQALDRIRKRAPRKGGAQFS